MDRRHKHKQTYSKKTLLDLLHRDPPELVNALSPCKSTPPRVQELKVTPVFSPNRDGRKDRARASFVLKRTDDVTATVIDHGGDAVRVLVPGRRLPAGRAMRLVWDGRTTGRRAAPDGTYRIRLNLRRQGRAVTLPRNIVKDTRPPVVRVTSIGPQRDTVPRPELLPRADGEPARISFQAPDRRKEVLVYRTDVTPAREVFDEPGGSPTTRAAGRGTPPPAGAASPPGPTS